MQPSKSYCSLVPSCGYISHVDKTLNREFAGRQYPLLSGWSSFLYLAYKKYNFYPLKIKDATSSIHYLTILQLADLQFSSSRALKPTRLSFWSNGGREDEEEVAPMTIHDSRRMAVLAELPFMVSFEDRVKVPLKLPLFCEKQLLACYCCT